MPGGLALPAQDPQRAEALGGTVHPQGRELGPGGLKPSQAVLCPALLPQQEPPNWHIPAADRAPKHKQLPRTQQG